MKTFSDRIPLLLFVGYILLFIWAAINPYDRADWWAENIPIVILVAVLVVLFIRGVRLSPLAYVLMAFLPYWHTIGGHYTFERVPFDWFNNLFGFKRNMFDRVGHFSVGFYAFGISGAVSVGGGTARLSVLKDPGRSDKCVAKKDGKSTGKFAYRLNGHIGTQGAFSFKYGFAAARIKFQKSRGQHGAFWMQPATSVNGATDPRLTGAEIDVIEYFGDKHPEGGLTSFIYSKNKKGQGVKTGSWIKDSKSFLTNKRDGWSKNYHVFSVQWTPNVIIFYIDGKETWRTSARVSKAQQYLILSLLASDYEALELPEVVAPLAAYVPATRSGDLVFTAGQTLELSATCTAGCSLFIRSCAISASARRYSTGITLTNFCA